MNTPPLTRSAQAQPRLPALQGAAFKLLTALVVTSLTLTLLILFAWLYRGPVPPAGPLDDAALQGYQRLSDLHQQQHREMFQVVVASAFFVLAQHTTETAITQNMT